MDSHRNYQVDVVYTDYSTTFIELTIMFLRLILLIYLSCDLLSGYFLT